ncbi:MAG TPA: FAD binding domain-containing protein [candidate division Zixibacteria bacterium]|nr:FAD binding domain-containing protein [candidate division Zixibacteria bacterium]
MPMKPSSYYRPQSIDEALDMLTRPDTKPLAGGTILLANGTGSAVVDLQDLDLDKQEYESGELTVGATTSLTRLSRFIAGDVMAGEADVTTGPGPMLMEAIHRAGPNTFRNAATVGGIVASRLTDSEFLASLLVLDANLNLLDPAAKKMTISDYLTQGERPKGLITGIEIPWIQGRGASERVARTPADYPIVSITIFKSDQDDARIAATGIDQRPLRVEAAEEALVAGAGIDEAAGAVRDRSSHPGDFRGDAGYRAEMAFVLTRRLLLEMGL